MKTGKSKKIAIIAGALALIVLAAGLLALGRWRQSRTMLASLETAAVTRGDLRITVDADGAVRREPDRAADVEDERHGRPGVFSTWRPGECRG